MDAFRIATYNVFGFPWKKTPIKEIVKWITTNCDVVALQEVWCNHSLWLSAFASYGWHFLRPARESHILGIFGSGLAVAWRATDWTLSDSRIYPFLSVVGFDCFATKGWFRVELIQKATGTPLRLINTHMQSDYEICDDLWRPIAEPVRMGQCFQMAETERRMPLCNTLMIGDMNTEMCWIPDGKWLTQHGGPTFPGTSQVLDHCAVWKNSDWELLNHRVVRVDYSDHWPVIWHLKINKPGKTNEQKC